MNLTYSKESIQMIEMYLNVIINQSQNMSSGNVAHKAACIRGHADAVKKLLVGPQYKCAICFDTGQVESADYEGKGQGVIHKLIACSCQKKE